MKKLLLFLATILAIVMMASVATSQKASANSIQFEVKALTFVSHYNKEFIPYYGYFLFVCDQYGFSEIDVATLTGIMKMETLFGRTGSGKWYNYGGIKPKGFARYENEFAGIEAIVMLYNDHYRGKTLYAINRKWIGHFNSNYYRDVQRTIRKLTSSL